MPTHKAPTGGPQQCKSGEGSVLHCTLFLISGPVCEQGRWSLRCPGWGMDPEDGSQGDLHIPILCQGPRKPSSFELRFSIAQMGQSCKAHLGFKIYL